MSDLNDAAGEQPLTRDEINRMINAALSHRAKATKPAAPEDFEAVVAAAVAKHLADLRPEPKPAADKADPVAEPELKGRLQKQEREIQELNRQIQAREAKIQDTEVRQALMSALAAEKIEGTRAATAAKLILGDKLVRWEDETVKYGDEGLDVHEGVKSWLKSAPEADYLRPAVSKAGGSGEQARRSSATQQVPSADVFEVLGNLWNV